MIQIENIKKTYAQGEVSVQALRGISFCINKGEFTAIAGPSGSGKTTLLNIIGVLDFPNEGKVFFNNRDLSSLNKKEQISFRLYHVGFVFQFYNLIPVFNVLENVEYILKIQGMAKKERHEKSQALLEEMEIGDLSRRFPRELSGGQQQRVAVARALVSSPDLILADEPTANLDSVSAEHLLNIMQTMCEKRKATFLFSTHDQRVMERAKRLIYLKDGQIDSDVLQEERK